ncbi:hypothetical protein ACFTZK_18460 [Streptomyces decoyicus]|uniref:hypothetical protein n=1 Tax=Streptomyces decoyicus TaxID=249567 RepID=UPI003639A8FA
MGFCQADDGSQRLDGRLQPAGVAGCGVPQPLFGAVVGVGAEHGQCFDCELVVAWRVCGKDAITHLLAQRIGPVVVAGHAAQPRQDELADGAAHAVLGVAVVLSEVSVAAVGDGDHRGEREGAAEGSRDVAKVRKAQEGLHAVVVVGGEFVPHVLDGRLRVAKGQ